MAKTRMHKLDVNIFSITLGLFGILVAITGVIWHGILGQPSVMNLLYPDFFSNTVNWLVLIIAFFIGGLIYGALVAWTYNYVIDKWGSGG